MKSKLRIIGALIIVATLAVLLISTFQDPLEQAKTSFAQGDYGKAIEILQPIMERDRDIEPEVKILYGEALLGAKLWDELNDYLQHLQKTLPAESLVDLKLNWADELVAMGYMDSGLVLYQEYLDYLDEEQLDRYMERALVSWSPPDLEQFPDHPLTQIFMAYQSLLDADDLGLEDFSRLTELDLSSYSPGVQSLFSKLLLTQSDRIARFIGPLAVENLDIHDLVWEALLYRNWHRPQWWLEIFKENIQHPLVDLSQALHESTLQTPWELNSTVILDEQLTRASWSAQGNLFAGFTPGGEQLYLSDKNGKLQSMDLPPGRDFSNTSFYWNPTGEILAGAGGLLGTDVSIPIEEDFDYLRIIGWYDEYTVLFSPMVYYTVAHDDGETTVSVSGDRYKFDLARGELTPISTDTSIAPRSVVIAGRSMDNDDLWLAEAMGVMPGRQPYTTNFMQGHWSPDGRFVVGNAIGPFNTLVLDFQEQTWQVVLDQEIIGWWHGSMLIRKHTEDGFLYYTLDPITHEMEVVHLGPEYLFAPCPLGKHLLQNTDDSLAIVEIN